MSNDMTATRTPTTATTPARALAAVMLLPSALAMATSEAQAETYYFHTDHLGTPQMVTDASGDVAWEGRYDPFGNATEVVADVEQNLRFPGQYLDRETGLHQNRFRDYDPAVGRYIESDLIGLLGGVNTYAYAMNSPTIFKDEMGLSGERINLGDGFTGRIDKFNYLGETKFEIHVYSPKGTEVSVYGPQGWINKHGLGSNPSDVPENVEASCRSQAIRIGRDIGKIPDKGRANIKGDRWMRFLRVMPVIAPLIEMTRPSPQRVPPGSDIEEYM